MPQFTLGRSLLVLVGIVTSSGCYIADWNETHIYNPLWTPHAKFHNGHTMSMGLFLGILTLAYIYTEPSSFSSSSAHRAVPAALVGSKKNGEDGSNNNNNNDIDRGSDANRVTGNDNASIHITDAAAVNSVKQAHALDRLNFVAVLASLYWVTQLSAILYPGVAAVDPPPGEPIDYSNFPQFWIISTLLLLTGAGWALEKKRIVAEWGGSRSSFSSSGEDQAQASGYKKQL